MGELKDGEADGGEAEVGKGGDGLELDGEIG